MEFTAKQLAEVLHGTVVGDPLATASTFAKIEHGKPGQLCFFANPKYEHYVYTSRASILLVNSDFEPKQEVTPTMIKVENAYAALAVLLKYVSEQKKAYKRHRGRCKVSLKAKIGKKVWIGDFVTVGAGSKVGDYTRIYNNVTIAENCTIGSKCIIYPGVHIFPGTVVGDRTILHAGCVIGDDGFGNVPNPDGTWTKIEHMGNVIIGSDVEIGSNTTIDKAPMESTVIENGVRIDNLCQIAHNVVVGENSVMAALTGVAGSAKIGKNCILAGQVGISGHISVADKTTIAAQAGVIGNIRKPGGVYLGSPAIPHSTFLRAYAKFKKSGEE